MTTNSEPVIAGSSGDLGELIQVAMQSISENLGSLIDKPVILQAGEPELLDAESFAAETKEDFVLLSGDLEQDYTGTVHLILNLTEAITFSCYMMMIPQEVVAQNRETQTFGEEAQETFGEIGNIIFSGLDETLRSKAPGKVSIRVKDQERHELPSELPKSITEEPFVLYSISCKIAEFPEAQGALLIPLETAEKIHGEPLTFGEEDGDDVMRRLESLPEDNIADIEQAPLQGRLATYVKDAELYKKIRKSCRRVGLGLEKRPKTEVPNPSAHRGKIVLIEVGRGELKCLDWCRRLKESGEIEVVMMLMEPTQYTVVLAYKAGADLILGWPIHERRLSAKLASLFEDEDSNSGDTVAASA